MRVQRPKNLSALKGFRRNCLKSWLIMGNCLPLGRKSLFPAKAVGFGQISLRVGPNFLVSRSASAPCIFSFLLRAQFDQAGIIRWGEVYLGGKLLKYKMYIRRNGTNLSETLKTLWVTHQLFSTLKTTLIIESW